MSNVFFLTQCVSFLWRTKSTSELDAPEFNGAVNQEQKIQLPLLIRPELRDLTGKNWIYLNNEVTNLLSGIKNSHKLDANLKIEKPSTAIPTAVFLSPRPLILWTPVKPGTVPAAPAAAWWDRSWSWSLFRGATPLQTAPAFVSTTALLLCDASSNRRRTKTHSWFRSGVRLWDQIPGIPVCLGWKHPIFNNNL